MFKLISSLPHARKKKIKETDTQKEFKLMDLQLSGLKYLHDMKIHCMFIKSQQSCDGQTGQDQAGL